MLAILLLAISKMHFTFANPRDDAKNGGAVAGDETRERAQEVAPEAAAPTMAEAIVDIFIIRIALGRGAAGGSVSFLSLRVSVIP